MRVLSRSALLAALVAPLLPACPALIEDDYREADGLGGASGGESPADGGDDAIDSGGATAAATGGVAGYGDPEGVGGTGVAGNVSGLGGGSGGTPAGGTTGAGGGTGGETTGGTSGTGGGTGGTTTGGGTGGTTTGGGTGGTTIGGTGGTAGGSGGSTGGAAGGGGDGGDAAGGTAGASGGSGGATGGAGGASGGATGGTAGAGGGTGGATGGTGGAAGGAAGSAGSDGMGGSVGTGGAACTSSPTNCEALADALIHRYSFNGTGTTVTDSVGDADGTALEGATLTGQGELDLAGGSSGEYVDLPNGIISDLEDATIEVWVIWHGGDPFQRIFDFGDAMQYTCMRGGMSAPEGQPGVCGRTYLNLMPSSGTGWTDGVRASFLIQPGVHPDDRLTIDGPVVSSQVELHLAVVVDDTGNQWRLYVDGQLEDSATFLDHLSDLNDINNWLGRSQFSDDQYRSFDGVYLEFRIYDAALTTSEIQTSFTEGPDASFLD